MDFDRRLIGLGVAALLELLPRRVNEVETLRGKAPTQRKTGSGVAAARSSFAVSDPVDTPPKQGSGTPTRARRSEDEGNESAARRKMIRDAAYRCFKDSGYYVATVDMICREAGVSKGSFYWHFKSKLHVYVDLLEVWTREVMDEVVEQFEAALLATDPASALAEAFTLEVRRARAVIPIWLELTQLAQREPEVQAALSRFYRRARTGIVDILRPVAPPGMSEQGLVSTSAAILGAYIGIMMQELADPKWMDAERITVTFLEIIKSALWPPA